MFQSRTWAALRPGFLIAYHRLVSREHAFDPPDAELAPQRTVPRELRDASDLWPLGYLEPGADPDFLDREVPPGKALLPRAVWWAIRLLAAATAALWLWMFLFYRG